ncbi:autotransporter outer membrane beta-barrel domain-containing protein [Halopseudomonas aestusnigri]|uniref:autotransporter outer membrane beta-barrel domain-containing protein n=1 Tax=Halopseudomonas aestusnigri TaxID=857252 RepID=UPI00300284FD
MFLLFGYGIENDFVSIDYYTGPGVSHCPSGCPRVDDSYDYAIISELVTLASLSNSLQSTSLGLSSLNSGLNMMINGAHSRPLSRMVAPGQSTFWVAGDWGTDEHGQRSGSTGLAEVSVGHNYGAVQLNASLGQTWARQNLSSDGRAESDGQYLLVEGIVPVSEEHKLYATVGAFGHWGEADIRRGYITLSTPDSSKGNADSNTWGLRARLDWVDALSLGNTGISPYADLSYTHSKLDGYTEQGGANPASFDSRTDRFTEARLGFGTETPLSWLAGYNLVANLEAAHRFEDRSAGVSGSIDGLFTFNLPGEDYQNDWLKAGVGVEGALGDGKASLMLNGTTDSDQPDMWVAASYQLAF